SRLPLPPPGSSVLPYTTLFRSGWTYLVRVTKQSKIMLADGTAVTFYDQVTMPGQCYCASGLVFKQRGRIPGHVRVLWGKTARDRDRKSTRLNSSHVKISYAVFC